PMMSADTPLPSLLVDAFRAAGVHAEMNDVSCDPYVALPASWEDYLRSLSPNGRRSVQRSLKALDAWAGGTMRLECVMGPADLEKGKQILVHLHHARWAGEGHAGVFRSPYYLQFHDAIMCRLAERGSL